jgi:polysaccharide export outer membrane protein
MGWRVLRVLMLAWVAALALAVPASGQQGAEYAIGPGDVLSISVWRHPDLDRNIVVRTDGTVTFPPIGDLRAAGLTPTQLSNELMQRLRDFTRETTQVTVSVEQFNSRAVFLTGQVMAPGRYSFERIPDILQLLSQAGGPLPSADLSHVSIVRPTVGGPKVIQVDVAAYMRGEAKTLLPAIEPGDTIEIPALAASGGLGGQGLVYVLGEVKTAGAFPSSGGLDVFQALALAGGTTPDAKLDDVTVVMDGGQSQAVVKLDLESILRDGTGSPFYLGPGDRVFVPARSRGIAGQIVNGAATVLGYARDALSSYLLYLTIDREIQDREARQTAASAAEQAAAAAAGQ